MIKSLLYIFSLIILPFGIYAQNINMSNGSATRCSDFFFDSGGGGTSSPYSSNETYTYTICPTSGNFVSVDFISFQLGTGDFLTVYNGNSTSAPLIGVYDVNTISPGLVAASPTTNPSGCLTFVFTSDGNDEGNGWAGAISCNTPCQNFYIDVDSLSPDTNNQGYIDICYQDTVHFEISGNYTMNNTWYNQSDATTTFSWAVLEGQNLDTIFDTTGTVFDYPFDSAGAYYIEVTAEDIQGCSNLNIISQIVRVSTYPDFTGTFQSDDTICYGDNVTLNGNVSSVGWSNYIPPFSGDSIGLPDASGASPGSYTSDILITSFQPSDSIQNINDIAEIVVNMEHTFIGDLEISVQCPSGNQVVLKQFPGGGGTNLGQPCLTTNNPPVPGLGWNYRWPNTAPVYGTMNAVSGTNSIATTSSCNAVAGAATTSMDSSSYTPITPLSNFIGCPINGTWSLTVVDQWGADDGTLFNWQINFDSTILPPTIISYDPGVDSTYWDHNTYAVFTSQDSIVVQPTVFDSTIDYTFSMVDNFGCIYDTTLSIYVRPACDAYCCNAQQPSISMQQVSCPLGSDGQIIVTPDVSTSPGPWTYKWYDANGNLLQQHDSISTPDTISGLVVGTYMIEIIDSNCCTVTQNINMTQVPAMLSNVGNVVNTTCYAVNCDGSATAFVSLGTAPYTFLWPSGETTQTASALCAGSDSVIIYDANGCVDTATFTIGEPDSIAVTATGTDTICISNSTPLTANATGGTTPYSYSWSNNGTSQTTNVNPVQTTTYTVSVTDANNCPIDTAMVTIYVREPLDGDTYPVDTICPGDIAITSAIGYGGDGNFTYQWSNGDYGSQGNFAYTTSGWAYVTITDGCGSPSYLDSAWVQVGGYPQLQVEVDAEPDTVCAGEPAYIAASGRNGDGEYTFTWDNGEGQGSYIAVTPTTTTTYTVTITDNCYTPSNTASVTIVVGNQTEVDITAEPTEGCYPLEVSFRVNNFNSAFNYDWNFGDEWERINMEDSISHTFRRIGCNDVWVKVSTEHGCETVERYECLVNVWPVPTARFTYNPYFPDILNPTVNFVDQSSGATSVIYDLENGYSIAQRNFSYTFPDTGSFSARQVVENQYGCMDTAYQYINIDYKTTVYIPNAFTPNGDNINDYFGLVGEGIQTEGFSMLIYNRWGNLVYQTNNPNDPWNGKMNNTGEIVESGTYVYYIRYTEHTGLDQYVHGQINVVK